MQSATRFQCIAKHEGLDDLIGESSVSKIGQADGLASVVLPQPLRELLGSKCRDGNQTLSLTLRIHLLLRLLLFLDLNLVFFSNPPQGFRVGHLLMLHQKRHSRTALT